MAIETTTIQPTAATGYDTYVYEGQPNANFGTQPTMILGFDTSSRIYRIYLRFNVADAIPAGRVVVGGTLELYFESATTSIGSQLWEPAASWQHTMLTWSNQPGFSGGQIGGNLPNAAGAVQWTNAAFDALVARWWSEPATNCGIAVRPTGEGVAWTTRSTISSSRNTTQTRRPKLHVRHRLAASAIPTSPAGTPENPTVFVDTLQPRLSWAYSSPDGGLQTKYQARILDALGSLIYDSGEVTSADDYHDVPPNTKLGYGGAYKWSVRAYDGAWGPWSTTAAFFRCIVSAPQNLTATPQPSTAAINLTWADHTAPRLAGYNVYRRQAGSTEWRQLNLQLISSTTYTDTAAASGVQYEYAVTAVALDGYESAKSATKTASVTVDATWIDDLKLEHEPTVFEPRLPFVGSSTPVLGRVTPTVFRRQTARVLRLEGICTSRAELQAVVSRLAAPGTHRYVDALGEVIRFEVTSDISFPHHRPYDPANPVYHWSVEVTEVAL